MSTTYDWSPVFQGLQGLGQQLMWRKMLQNFAGPQSSSQPAFDPTSDSPANGGITGNLPRTPLHSNPIAPVPTQFGPVGGIPSASMPVPQTQAPSAPPISNISRLMPLLQMAGPQLGMPLLLQAMMKQNEYDPTPHVGINPATGKRGQFLVSKEGGQPKWLDAAPDTEVKIENGVAYDPHGTQPGQIFNDPNKAFSPTGAPNQGYQDYEIKKAGAGRPQVSLNVSADKSFGTQLGENAGKILDASHSAALGSLDTIRTANQIRGALDTGQVSAGPGATAGQFIRQVAGGDESKIVATRQTIQGLAKLALAARSALKGQGQISDYEGRLLQKATAGDIDSMTVPEIRTITDVADRAARFSIHQNTANVDKARKAAPNNQDLVDFYSVAEPPAYVAPPKASGEWGQPRVVTPR